MRAVAVVRFGVLLAACGGWACTAHAGENDRGGRAGATGTLPTLVLLTPGTKVDKAPPPGWSHLVLKSVPRLASGDLESLPGFAKSTATLFRSVVLADVRPAEGERAGYELRRIGLGLCVPADGVDTVVSTARLDALPVALSLVQRKVLARAEEEMMRGRIKGRTATFALFSAPAEMKVGEAHRPVWLRYALLVDPATGALETLLWTLDADPAGREPPEHLVRLAPNLVFDCKLDVAADRLLESIPVYWSFALAELPPGRPLKFPPDLRAWALKDKLEPDEAATFEAALRRSLAALK